MESKRQTNPINLRIKKSLLRIPKRRRRTTYIQINFILTKIIKTLKYRKVNQSNQSKKLNGPLFIVLVHVE